MWVKYLSMSRYFYMNYKQWKGTLKFILCGLSVDPLCNVVQAVIRMWCLLKIVSFYTVKISLNISLFVITI